MIIKNIISISLEKFKTQKRTEKLIKSFRPKNNEAIVYQNLRLEHKWSSVHKNH